MANDDDDGCKCKLVFNELQKQQIWINKWKEKEKKRRKRFLNELPMVVLVDDAIGLKLSSIESPHSDRARARSLWKMQFVFIHSRHI